MKKNTFLIISCLLLFFSTNSLAQINGSKLRISLITCAPGNELYALFGHTAIRILDSTNGSDIVYNYGTFDFNDANFYTKFIRGKLDYFLSTEDYTSFLNIYQYEMRSVTEQVLAFSPEQKISIQAFLNNNLLGNNKYYHYDFLYDNCTTRALQIINTNDTLLTSINNKLVPNGTTYRNMLHSYLDAGSHPWSKLGIDLLLGAKTDKVVTVKESMFLPELLQKGVNNSQGKIVAATTQPYSTNNTYVATGKYLPIICTTIFALLIIGIAETKKANRLIPTIDSILFYITGLVGILLLFMWFGTNHQTCSNNYNLLWAMPINFFAAFYVWKKPNFFKVYCTIYSILLALLLLSWWWLPQQLNIAFIPIVVLLSYRTYHLSK